MIEKLLALQERDQRIRTLQVELHAIPAEQEKRDDQIRNSEKTLEQAKTRLREIEIERKKLELEVQAKEQSVARYKQQQFQTRKNEEYAALGHEIDAALRAISDIEDRELALMEQADQMKAGMRQAEQAHSDETTRLVAEGQDLARKKDNVEARIAELQAARAALATDLEEDIRVRYERLFKSKHGVALAELAHEVCMGCHMKVPTQVCWGVKAQRTIVHCPNCGRMLYQAA